MFTDNTIHKINKNNPAEMDRSGSKAYRIPLLSSWATYLVKSIFFFLRCVSKHLSWDRKLVG